MEQEDMRAGDVLAGEMPSGDVPQERLGYFKLGKCQISHRVGLLLSLGVAMLGIAAITLAALARQGDDGSGLDPAIEELIPADGADVLVQNDVGIDLIDNQRYEISLWVNSVQIPEGETFFSGTTNRLTYATGEGQTVEELRPGQNCARAEYFEITRGPEAVRSVAWCFQAL